MFIDSHKPPTCGRLGAINIQRKFVKEFDELAYSCSLWHCEYFSICFSDKIGAKLKMHYFHRETTNVTTYLLMSVVDFSSTDRAAISWKRKFCIEKCINLLNSLASG